MRRTALIALLLLTTSCGGGRGTTTPAVTPGRGAITIAIVPNPIVATRVDGNTYDFPFEVVVREVGGRPVEVQRVTAVVLVLGGIRMATETYDAAKINSLGYSTRVPANGEIRYRFTPRRSVPDERLFGGVSADLTVEARDDSGTPLSSTTSVTVRR